MSAVKSVLLAIVVATRKKDQAGKVLMHVQRACAFAQGQLNQLESYATETDVRWTETAQVGATTELIRHHYQFMERLQQDVYKRQPLTQGSSKTGRGHCQNQGGHARAGG